VNERAPQAPPEAAEWLAELPCRVAEIFVDHAAGGKIALCHRDDAQREDLTTRDTAEAAIELARYDDAGNYRPLKTAPNLRHGWRLLLGDLAAARAALDFFYPARAAAYEAWRHRRLAPTAFRDTLARQTGMYRAAAKISDEQANNLIAHFCRSDGGCLRTILWKRDANGACPSDLLPPEKFDSTHDQTGRGEHALPLQCQEICNLLVAAAREVVKAPQ
jgi:sirohydrochlorin cobaltochelatase